MVERLNDHHKTHTHTHGYTNTLTHHTINQFYKGRQSVVGFFGQIELGQLEDDSHMTMASRRS